MNPITTAFFPFTFISEKWAAACCARFGPVVVYQPAAGATPAAVEALAEEGQIRLRFPVKGDDARLVDLARQFRNWGEVHQNHAAALKPFAETGFYNQEFVPEISTEILKGGKQEVPEPEPLFTARLFLLMAQEFDRQAAELENQLAFADNTEKQMFARIRGQDDQSGPPSEFSTHGSGAGFADGDSGAYMVEARIRAWRRLVQSDPDAPEVWITSSTAVIAALQEHFERLVAIDSLPENVQAGLPKQGKPVSAPGTVFYEMAGSGRIIGLLAHAGGGNKKTLEAP